MLVPAGLHCEVFPAEQGLVGWHGRDRTVLCYFELGLRLMENGKKHLTVRSSHGVRTESLLN